MDLAESGAEQPVRWMPTVVCHDMQQAQHGPDVYFLEIRVTAQVAGEGPPSWPRQVPADLGRRIAALVREQCGAGPP